MNKRDKRIAELEDELAVTLAAKDAKTRGLGVALAAAKVQDEKIVVLIHTLSLARDRLDTIHRLTLPAETE